MDPAVRRTVARAIGVVLFLLGTTWLVDTLSSGRAVASPGERDANAPSAEGTVVLLHGLGRSPANMLILEWRLESRGYRVCNVGYDTRVSRIEEAIDAVYNGIVDCRSGGGPLHFVTHSLGGLVMRGLLGERSFDELGRAVMLAPPNGGSEIADRLGEFGLLKSMMGPLATRLGTGEDDLPNTLPAPPIPFGVIAGDQWINPAGPLWLPAPHDGTVSVARTRLEGMRDHIVMPYTHTFIVSAGPVADQVDTFLRQGRFDPARITAPRGTGERID
jgi:triacylglycerol lipase